MVRSRLPCIACVIPLVWRRKRARIEYVLSAGMYTPTSIADEVSVWIGAAPEFTKVSLLPCRCSLLPCASMFLRSPISHIHRDFLPSRWAQGEITIFIRLVFTYLRHFPARNYLAQIGIIFERNDLYFSLTYTILSYLQTVALVSYVNNCTQPELLMWK